MPADNGTIVENADFRSSFTPDRVATVPIPPNRRSRRETRSKDGRARSLWFWPCARVASARANAAWRERRRLRATSWPMGARHFCGARTMDRDYWTLFPILPRMGWMKEGKVWKNNGLTLCADHCFRSKRGLAHTMPTSPDWLSYILLTHAALPRLLAVHSSLLSSRASKAFCVPIMRQWIPFCDIE